MNKNYIPVILGLIVAAGATFLLWLGNQPKITYYPDQKIKTVSPRSFFRENGEAQLFAPNGKVLKKYTMLNGVKYGSSVIITDTGEIRMNYVDGKISGPVSFDIDENLFDNLNIEISDNIMTVKNKNSLDNDFTVDSRVVCDEEQFISALKDVVNNQNLRTFSQFAGCLNIENAKFGDDEFSCRLQGSFQYPEFRKNTTLECETDFDIPYADEMPEFFDFLKDAHHNKLLLDYDVSRNVLAYKQKYDNDKFSMTVNFIGIKEIIPEITKFAFSEQKNSDVVKLTTAIIKNLTISDSQMYMYGQKSGETSGDFNLVNGFSQPWISRSYINGTPVLQTKIQNNTLVFTVNYPVSGKLFTAIGFKFKDNLNSQYRKLIKKSLNELMRSNFDFETMATRFQPGDFNDLLNTFDSLSASLQNKKGEKVIAGVLKLKKRIDLNDLDIEPEEMFEAKVYTYKNNKVAKVIKSTADGKINVNGRDFDTYDFAEYISHDDIVERVKSCGEEFFAEFKKIMKDIENNKKVSFGFGDPLFGGVLAVGGIAGYSKAMSKYKTNKAIDQLTIIIVNTRSFFAAQKDYSNMSKEIIDNSHLIPDEMKSGNDYINVFGGKVTLTTADRFAIDDNKAFLLTYPQVSQDACINIATSDWGSGSSSGLIALGVNTSVAEKADQCSINGLAGNGAIVCGGQGVMSISTAVSACKPGNTNTLYFKFF